MRTIWEKLTTLGAADMVALVNGCDLVSAMKLALGQPGDEITARGAVLPGDSGGGRFRWDATSTGADDGVFCIVPDANPASGRWLRVIETTTFNLAWWGVDASGIVAADTALQMADAVAAAAGVALKIPTGTFQFDLSYALLASIELAAGAVLRPGSGVALTLADTPAVDFSAKIFDLSAGGAVTIARPTKPVWPTWWGASGKAISTLIAVAIGTGQHSLVASPGTWSQANVGNTIIVANAGNPGAANTELQSVINMVSTDGSIATLRDAAQQALGNGSSTRVSWGADDTRAIAAAMTSSAGGRPIAIDFASGNYLIDAAQPTFATAHILAQAVGRATIIRMNPATPSTYPPWNFSGSNVIIAGLDFVSTDGTLLPPILTAKVNPIEPPPSIKKNSSFTITAAATHHFIDSTAATVLATLPPAPRLDERYFVKDWTGSASAANPIGLAGNGNMIDGQPSLPNLITSPFGWAWVQFNGTSWSVVG